MRAADRPDGRYFVIRGRRDATPGQCDFPPNWTSNGHPVGESFGILEMVKRKDTRWG